MDSIIPALIDIHNKERTKLPFTVNDKKFTERYKKAIEKGKF